ncbi:MAG: hypothetical protein QOH18_91 [Solirubrobacterales bacterium]|nr:hypothetical protein [Solirubrobacterales bacterium]
MKARRSQNLRSLGIGTAIAVAALVGVLAPAAAAAPSNDNFAARASLGNALPVHLSESNAEATRETGEEINGFAKGRSIWWEWEAPVSGWTTVSVCGSEMLSVVNVFEGAELAHLTSLTGRRGNGDEGPQCWASQTTYTFDATAGREYVIGADGNGYYVPPPPPEEAFIPSGEGMITLSIEATPPPPNDDFATPIRLGEHFQEVGQSPFEEPNEDQYFIEQTPGYNWGATKQAGEPDHAGDPGGASVWYAWTPPRSGEAWISMQGGGGGPKLLALYKGSGLTELVLVASSSPGSWSSFKAPVTGGEEYRIAVDGSPTAKPLEPQWDMFMGSFNVGIQLKAPSVACASCGGAWHPPTVPPPTPRYVPAVQLGPHRVNATSRSATFRFSSPTAGAAFICKVDRKAYGACASPFKVKGLKPGRHVFRVVATMGGMTSASPGVVHFTVRAQHRRHHRVG